MTIQLLQGLNNSRTLPTENIQLLLDNLATYMNSISLESSATMWTNILNQFDTFFRRLTEILPVPCDVTSVLKIITSLLKVNGINNAKVTCFVPILINTIHVISCTLYFFCFCFYFELADSVYKVTSWLQYNKNLINPETKLYMIS